MTRSGSNCRTTAAAVPFQRGFAICRDASHASVGYVGGHTRCVPTGLSHHKFLCHIAYADEIHALRQVVHVYLLGFCGDDTCH